MLQPSDILGPSARIATRLGDYENRPQQLEMADAVYQAISQQHHLVVEAGTGVGKSFGYLVPAILAATDDQCPSAKEGTRSKRIIVSTHTISLQEQLLRKDIPFLRSVMPREFTAVLAKGRSNYLSLRRLGSAQARAHNLWSDPGPLGELESIGKWSQSTNDGSLSELDFRPNTTVWDEIASDSGNCMGNSCRRYGECFYFQARRRTQNAQIIVVNHALFFSDLALRALGVNLLPEYDAVILDEAHTIEGVAGDHLGLGISSGQVTYTLNRLFNDKQNKGLLVDRNLVQAQQEVVACHIAATEFFSELHQWYDDLNQDPARGYSFNGRVRHPHIVDNCLSGPLRKLSQSIRLAATQIDEDSDRLDMISASDRLVILADATDAWLEQDESDQAYWVEASWGRGDQSRVHLASAPIDVGPSLNAKLFQNVPSVIMTSATLGAGERDSFVYFRSRIGLTEGESKQLGSPFDYQRQATIRIVPDFPDPTRDAQAFLIATQSAIEHYVGQTNGHAFVLFTSYDLMKKVGSGIASWLAEKDLALYTQAAGVPRHQLLERFKDRPKGVLFGTDSFWQGVDVPGSALQLVIIPRLPFNVPDQPLIQARLESITERGGNPFLEFQLPNAIIKLRQGFGRLIRSKSDTGQVVILDPRIRTKTYGTRFLNSLPDCKVVEDSFAQFQR